MDWPRIPADGLRGRGLLRSTSASSSRSGLRLGLDGMHGMRMHFTFMIA